MNESVMLQWIRDIWAKYTKRCPSILILDSFSGHLTEEVQRAFSECNTTTIVIPSGCTSVLQPLDVSINKPVKSIMRNAWSDYMLTQVEAQDAPGNIKPPSKQDILEWTASALKKIESNPAAIIKKSFLVTGISNALGSHESEMIRNDSVRQEIETVMNDVFGDELMGYHNVPSDSDDPFSSSESEDEEVDQQD